MMSLAEAAVAMQAQLMGSDARFSGVSTDSRTIARGELFFAIRGERFDGHAFLGAAAARGAAGAVVDASAPGEPPLPLLVADDVRRALGRLGRHWRERFTPVLIAVTGSNGKTTIKEMLASLLLRHAGEAGVLVAAAPPRAGRHPVPHTAPYRSIYCSQACHVSFASTSSDS